MRHLAAAATTILLALAPPATAAAAAGVVGAPRPPTIPAFCGKPAGRFLSRRYSIARTTRSSQRADGCDPRRRLASSAAAAAAAALRLAPESEEADDARSSTDAAEQRLDSGGDGGIYRPFAVHAWSKLEESGLFRSSEPTSAAPPYSSVPDDLASNESPARGLSEGTTVGIEVRSMPGVGTDGGGGGVGGVGGVGGASRLARYALLETLSPPPPPSSSSDDGGDIDGVRRRGRSSVNDAIHVLNLVVFPNPDLATVGLPVLGLDLVTLPGKKHLVAMDFQPVAPLPPQQEQQEQEQQQQQQQQQPDSDKKRRRVILPGRYAEYESRLADLHRLHCVDSDRLPWGGDIPDVAKRYFSPYAVWTRLVGEEALEVVRKEVWDAFRDYVDLYIELMLRVQRDVESGEVVINSGGMGSGGGGSRDENEAIEGQRDYLLYRKENDPARPMLKSLYGEEWTERLIGEVLFKMI